MSTASTARNMGGHIGKSKKDKTSLWLLSMVVSLIIVVANVAMSGWQSHQLADARTRLADLRVVAQHLPALSQDTARGKSKAFVELDQARNSIDETLSWLQLSYGKQKAMNEVLTNLEQSWEPLATRIGQIMSARQTVQAVLNRAEQLTTTLPSLQLRLNRALPAITGESLTAVQLEGVLQLSATLNLLVGHAQDLRSGEAQINTAGVALVSQAARFEQMLDALRDGDTALELAPVRGTAAQAALAQMAIQWFPIKADIDALGVQLEELSVTLSSTDTLAAPIASFLQNSRQAFETLSHISTFGSPKDTRPFPNFWISLVFFGFALFSLISFIHSLLESRNHEQQMRYRAQEEFNKRNQQAIMRLLEEIVALSEGDLTIQATVTEDMTGAIADAVNYTIEELRDLVTKIRNVSNQVARAAQESQITSMELAQAAVQQTDQITSASDRIGEMALSIEQVSHNSNESAEVAQRSVLIAAEGADVVRQTIQGMDQIRDQIQETSKRIKRLGESSQEIGSIVELINSISEQTNILALNAAVQAASAGEAGRGFAVVADEVQRLAERTSNATRRIEGLVQAIQADTSETINSMEQTTAEVVSGAHLAEDAGTALTEIERVSNDLNNLISNISVAAQQQAAAASNITRSMGSIRKIAGQTAQGAGQTAESLGHLNQMAATMMRLVAGFKLPHSEAAS